MLNKTEQKKVIEGLSLLIDNELKETKRIYDIFTHEVNGKITHEVTDDIRDSVTRATDIMQIANYYFRYETAFTGLRKKYLDFIEMVNNKK